MAEKRYYPKCATHLEALGEHLKDSYSSGKYDVQLIKMDDAEGKGALFQAKEKYDEEWKGWTSKLTGLDTAATVKMVVQGENLNVEVGGGKWIDKAAVASFAWFVTFGFLLIPAGIGALKQRNLLKKMVSDIDNFMSPVSGHPVESAPTKCPKCNATVKEGAKFCGKCGNALA